jgi:hypothetical protein
MMSIIEFYNIDNTLAENTLSAAAASARARWYRPHDRQRCGGRAT